MTVKERTGDRHVALASTVRREILRLLANAAEPLDAAAVATECGIHVTTARFHLEQLESAAMVTREIVHRSGRGRPRMVYRVLELASREDSLRELSEVLADALASVSDDGKARAMEAGERWSRLFADQTTPGSGDDLGSLSRVFEKIGFAPEMREDGRIIALHECPFRDVASAHPNVVCSAHQGLLAGLVNHLGHSEAEATLQPFVEPELCLVRLRGPLATSGHGETAAKEL
ncbi:MAG TPA: helix-turn-helix domain-containing protein [Leifsonia sp.]|nr:helix-turn-helix domain-containing protein [Leifsonia sp.]